LRERARAAECSILTEELQPSATMSLVKLFEEATAEQRAAAIRQPASLRLNTTGKVRGTCTGCILAIKSPAASVTSKKNFNPVIAALSDTGETP
jgi:hypothetical protein